MKIGSINKISLSLVALLAMGVVEQATAIDALKLGKREQCPAIDTKQFNGAINELLTTKTANHQFVKALQDKVKEIGQCNEARFSDSENLMVRLSHLSLPADKKKSGRLTIFSKKQKEINTDSESTVKIVEETFKPTRFSKDAFMTLANNLKIEVPYVNKDGKQLESVDLCNYEVVTKDNKIIYLSTYLYNYRK